MNPQIKILLASSSRNRRELIKKTGWNVYFDSPEIDEKLIRCSDIHRLPLLIANAKMEHILKTRTFDSETIIITSDQVVKYNNEVREKPVDKNEATRFLLSYSNSKLSTINAIVITHFPSMKQVSSVDITVIAFNELEDTLVNEITSSETILTYAGALDLNNNNLKEKILIISGSIQSAMGLDVEVCSKLITSLL